MNEIRRFEPIIAVPPGEIILEKMLYLNMTQKELAIRTGLSEKHISQVLSGSVNIEVRLATKIGNVVGISPYIILKLETTYRELLLTEITEKEIELSKKIPYNELVKRSFFEKKDIPLDRVKQLRNFFAVSSLEFIEKLYEGCLVCSKEQTKVNRNYELYTWCRMAEKSAENVQANTLNLKKLQNIMPVIRKHMNNDDVNKAFSLAKKLCAESGVIVILAEHMKNSGVNAIHLKKDRKTIVQFSGRNKNFDSVWFSFIHELFHILDGKKVFDDAELENQINEMTANFIIDKNSYTNFVVKNNFSKSAIIKFAKSIHTHPAFVIGKLKKDKFIQYNMFNDLVPKLSITSY